MKVGRTQPRGGVGVAELDRAERLNASSNRKGGVRGRLSRLQREGSLQLSMGGGVANGDLNLGEEATGPIGQAWLPQAQV